MDDHKYYIALHNEVQLKFSKAEVLPCSQEMLGPTYDQVVVHSNLPVLHVDHHNLKQISRSRLHRFISR